MSDKKKQKVKDSGLDDLDDYARQIWLAGLGAYARLGKEGSKLFDALIREGEETEKAAKKGSLDGARGKVEKARKKLTDKISGWEEVLDKRLQGAAERLGLASQSDLRALTKRIDALASAVDKLSVTSSAEPRPAAKAGNKGVTAKPAASNAAKADAAPKAAAKPAASKPAAKPAARAATARKPASEASNTTVGSKASARSSASSGVKTAPRRRTAPKAATRGKTSPAPASDTAPGTPPEL